jgi:protein-L-isoaspartate(D-aspartate) O-methyltransferase
MSQVKSWSPLEQMVQQQIIERGITDERVIDAMRKVPRDKFFPRDGRDHAFADRASPIGHGQTISQPYMVALMTQRLEVASESRVLEIGTGSGYQAAVLSRLAAQVYSVERVKPLLDEAWERLMAMGVRNVHFRHGDGMLGWSDAAPFDRILIAAGAPALPRQLLLDQLKDGGIAILPIGASETQSLVRVERQGDQFALTDICPCRFVKLIGQGAWADEKQ